MLKLYRKEVKKRAILNLHRAKRVADSLLSQGNLVLHIVKQARQRYRGQHLKKKIYSLHDSSVVCIRKGKKSRPNEYGIKFNVSVDKNGFIITHEEQSKNIHDAKLLEPALKHWEVVTGHLPDQVNGDRGYVQNSKNLSQRMKKIQRMCIPSKGNKKHPEHKKPWFRKGQRLRAQIEGTIGHLKSRGRCRYLGITGSKTHLTLNCINWNLTKLSKYAS